MAKIATPFETFLDGQVDFWGLDKNQRPVLLASGICFQSRVVGSTRYYNAELAGHKVERVIRIPRSNVVSTGCFAVIAEQQYKLTRIQLIPETSPQCLDLTLEQPEMLLQFDPDALGPGGRL